MKAVRDIWNLRTWTSATMPYWTSADHSRYLRKHLCKGCQRNGVKSFAAACNACSKPRRRGRPALVRPAALGSADAMSQGDSDSVNETFTCADAWAVQEAGQAGDLPPRDVADQREALPGWVDLQETDDGRVHFTAHRMYACNRDPRIQEPCCSLPTFRQPQAIAGVLGFQSDHMKDDRYGCERLSFGCSVPHYHPGVVDAPVFDFLPYYHTPQMCITSVSAPACEELMSQYQRGTSCKQHYSSSTMMWEHGDAAWGTCRYHIASAPSTLPEWP